MKVQKVLITSYHSSLNCGDRALLEMNIKHLDEAFQSPEISVAVNWPNEPYFHQPNHVRVVQSAWNAIGIRTDQSFWHQFSNMIIGMTYAELYRKGVRISVPPRWREVFSSYEQADVVASVSSTLFYSTGRFGWPFPVKTWTIQLAHLFKKPFIVMPQSIGPLRWGWEKKLLLSAYEKSVIVLLRDQESLRLADSLGLPHNKVIFAPDPTFAYPTGSTHEATALMNRYGYRAGEISIGLTLIPWQGRWINQEVMTNYFDELAGFIIRLCRSTTAKVYLFNQVTGPTILDDDRVAARSLTSRIKGYENQCIYINEVLTPALLKACYGKLDLLIATRMHSGIFALGEGVPVLYIGYLQKTRGLMEWLGLSDWVIELNEINQDNLWEKTMLALAGKSSRVEIINQKLPQILEDIQKTPELIKAAYSNA